SGRPARCRPPRPSCRPGRGRQTQRRRGRQAPERARQAAGRFPSVYSPDGRVRAGAARRQVWESIMAQHTEQGKFPRRCKTRVVCRGVSGVPRGEPKIFQQRQLKCPPLPFTVLMPCPRSEDNNPCETVRGVGVRFVGARHVHAATVGELCLFRSENRAPKTQDSTQASLLLSVSNHEAVSPQTPLPTSRPLPSPPPLPST